MTSRKELKVLKYEWTLRLRDARLFEEKEALAVSKIMGLSSSCVCGVEEYNGKWVVGLYEGQNIEIGLYKNGALGYLV